jgi:hypothetical protein
MNWMIDTLEDYFLVRVFLYLPRPPYLFHAIFCFITAQNYGYDLPNVLFHI